MPSVGLSVAPKDSTAPGRTARPSAARVEAWRERAASSWQSSPIAALCLAVVALVLDVRQGAASARLALAGARTAELERRLTQLAQRLEVVEAEVDARGGFASDAPSSAGTVRTAGVAISHLGLVRFDAFEDAGGAQSFALALIDDDGDGVVLTSLHSRQSTRLYIKGVRRGVADSAALGRGGARHAERRDRAHGVTAELSRPSAPASRFDDSHPHTPGPIRARHPESSASTRAPVSIEGVRGLLAGLDRRQRQAVTHGDGPLLVIAGPGTGKTEVITRRVAWLIASRRARPSQILALTFTERAADEMQARVDLLVPYGQADTAIHTFHAFGDWLLREHGHAIGRPMDPRVIGRAEAIVLLRERLFELGLKRYRPLGDPTRFAGSARGPLRAGQGGRPRPG